MQMLWIWAALVCAPDADTFASLQSLGYFDSAPTENPEDRGVTLLRGAAYDGMNLLSSRHQATAHLVDMQGEVLHSWQDPGVARWMHVELQQNGDLVALTKDTWLTRLDADSQVRWRLKIRAHHDFVVARGGKLLVLSRRAVMKSFPGYGRLPILEDTLAWVSPNGELLSEVSLLAPVEHLIPEARLEAIHSAFGKAAARGVSWRRLARAEAIGDVTHTNSVEILSQPIPGVAPAGSVLLSMRDIDRIVILDASLTRVLWVWGADELEGQHHATQLEDGHILVFDNGVRRNQSRVLQLDPTQGRIVWSYTHPQLFTRLRGAAQKLPNGNVLITESDTGHAIEITPDKKPVWEFWNPELRTDRGRVERDAIYRLLRYPPSAVAALP